ncbi:MAG: hypothetical protein H7329_09195 [Opitutaceae bacterium]|nr:hypothetical protein [Cytophagales bacterium]
MNSTFFECPISKALNCLGLFTEEEKDENIVILNTLANHAVDWDQLIPKNHYLSSESCLANEKSYPKNIKALYAIIYKDKKPVFCSKFQDVRITSENIRKHKRGEFVRIATNLVLNIYELNLLVCGNVFKDGLTGFYYDHSVFNIEEANAALLKAIEKITRKECFSGVMLKDVPNGFGFANDNRNFSFDNDISMNMDILPEWNSLEDYQKDLSKKYAARAKKILLSASEVIVRDFPLSDILNYTSELHNLYKQIIKHQSFVFGTLEENYFEEMKKAFPHSYSVKGMFLDNKLVGFYSTFENTNELEVHYVGIDYTFNSSHNLYFLIHFLTLKEAIEKRKSYLNMGRTSLEAKAILGCLPKYNNTFIHFLNPLAEKAFHYFKQNLSESDNWKTRNPLKVGGKLEEAVV